MTLRSGQTLLHYRLVEKLGEGGMGVVWGVPQALFDDPDGRHFAMIRNEEPVSSELRVVVGALPERAGE